MSNDMPIGTGEIARRYGVPLHKVLYVIRSRSIQPMGKVGNLRVFSPADVERVGSELARIGR